MATLAVDEVIDVDASAPLGGVSSVSASNVVNVEPSSPVRKRPRAQGVSKGAVEDGPPPLLVSSGIPNGAAGAVGMNVLNNVSGRMAEQFSIDKVKGLSSFHLSSHFDLYSTTVSGTGWDCGYRNTMMFISSLLREDTMIGPMLARSGVTAVPCIENIQARIEAAWRRGFDVDGALFYRHRLVGKSGSESWIGAVEICCLLRGMGLRALVADFEKTKSASGNHQELLDWVLNYFDTRCRAGGCLKCRNTFFGRAGSFICPLILQHQGHSRTIAGKCSISTVFRSTRSLRLPIRRLCHVFAVFLLSVLFLPCFGTSSPPLRC